MTSSTTIHERPVDTVSRALSVSVLIAVIFATFRIFHGANLPFLAFSVAGASLIRFTYQLSIWRGVFTVASAFLLYAVYTLLGGMPGDYSGAAIVSAIAFLGLGSMLSLGFQAFRKTDALAPLLLASFCPVLMIVTNFALYATIALQPRVFDLHLYSFDGFLGGQGSFVIGQWFAAASVLRTTCFFVYGALPLAQVLVLWLYWRGQRMPAKPAVVFIVGGVAGFLLYQICPAMGPVHVFPQDYPGHVPPALDPHALTLSSAPRNALPSLHTAWAILICWSLRFTNRSIRIASVAFLMLTLMATLGFGEHYLIDLVVAVPFTMAVQAASTRKFGPGAGWIGVTIAWCVYLRWMLPVFPLARPTAWTLGLMTLVLPFSSSALQHVTALLRGAGSPLAASGRAGESESSPSPSC